MDPSVSFVLALVAIVVAVPSALAAVWALRQTAHYQPRSNLELGWSEDDFSGFLEQPVPENNVPFVNVTIHNTGSAPARKVRVDIDTAAVTVGRAWMARTVIAPYDLWVVQVPLFEVVRQPNNDMLIVGAHDILYPKMTVTWLNDYGNGEQSATRIVQGIDW